MQVNIQRLMADIEAYADYGKSAHGGVTRPSFSPADYEVRERFIKEIEAMGLEVTIDGAANIWGRLKGTGKREGSLVIGSHLDSVPNGGKFDGPLGTLMAKEIIKTLLEHNVTLDHDLEIVSFTAEESNDFNLSTFGSRSFVGRLTAGMLEHACDSTGRSLNAELTKAGGGLEHFPLMQEMWKKKRAFIELHIEQGQRLESADIAVAVIDKVVGAYRSNVRVIGQSNHSGTTMMEHRQDALTAAAEMVLAVERQCKQSNSGVVGTVGKLNVSPNAANIVPGQVDFIFEVRGETEEKIQQTIAAVQKAWNEIAGRRQVKVEQQTFLDQKPVMLDKEIVHLLQKTAKQMREPYMILPSMAVHDAAHMAKITKSAMVFVKSIDGKSHCPEELSLPEDIEKAGNLILQGIINIDRELSQKPLVYQGNQET
ncbi:Zn-dependent hydrolase [Neobacillus kokaensis]|uniref:Zn-dependent hydrolase n=1 Tax=Neobacillus kokaensis TaxID=2759023 RepID=A0ABQ3N4M1_9BACI|nr:Zn-dependent hydrolase [Neobacillus kokaensis]GHH99878.1 Zn-dependent hydrolase [Neobacillus kokaensis]